MARRGQQLKRQSIAQRLLAIHARRLQQHPDVLGAGVGAPYSEKKKQITRKGRRGQPIHWTKLALKVFVREKREPNEAERIPPYVTLKVGKGAGAKTYKFRVDVVTLGEVRQAPGRSLLQAGQTGWPAMRKPLPGCRLLFGIPSSAANGSADLPNRFDPEEFGWLKVGTIGCVAGTEEQPYLLTAGHVTTEIYKSDPQFPTQPEDKCMIGFDGENAMLCPIDAVTRIVPHSPLTTDGRTVDAVAIPFPKQLLQESLPHWPVPSAPDLFWFFGREAYVLVERDGALHKVRGEIEGI